MVSSYSIVMSVVDYWSTYFLLITELSIIREYNGARGARENKKRQEELQWR